MINEYTIPLCLIFFGLGMLIGKSTKKEVDYD